MQRLTARFLLLFALVGTFLPIALQATSAPSHACCRRSAAHHCNDSAITTDETVIRNAGCSRDCCRAVTTSQAAHPVRRQTNIFAQRATAPIAQLQTSAPVTDLFSAHSTRAPPAC